MNQMTLPFRNKNLISRMLNNKIDCLKRKGMPRRQKRDTIDGTMAMTIELTL
jgi:hypothetical protein